MNNELLKQVLEDLKKDKDDYFHTGFKALDDFIKSPSEGAFVLVGGRPSMGKTSFILSILLNIVERNEKILLFSSQYSKETAVKRLAFLKSGISAEKNYGKLSNNDFKALAKSMEEMANWDLKLDDNCGIELGEIIKKVGEEKPKVVFIEDIDSMELVPEEANTQVVFDSLQKLAKENNCIIFATTTLSRKPEERKNHLPMISDLKEFRSTKFVDIVLLLYRGAYYGYKQSKKDLSPNSEIIVEKNKYAQKGVVRLEFDSEYGKFYEKPLPPELIF